jgi:hypothetical protein
MGPARPRRVDGLLRAVRGEGGEMLGKKFTSNTKSFSSPLLLS